ncbi:hypothetical protein PG984_006795 [Apiospora sp. TS-2023a]
MDNTDDSPKSLLCDRCQEWDNIDVHKTEIWERCPTDCDTVDDELPLELRLRESLLYFLPAEHILENQDSCLICQAVSSAVQTRCSTDEGAICLQSGGAVRIQGPFSFKWHRDGSPFNSHLTGLEEETPVIPLFLVIDVIRDQRSELDSCQRSELHFTPRFKFHYTQQRKSRLRRVEDWEVNYFDIALLQRWIGRCDQVHGPRCRGDQTTGGLPQEFRVIDVLNLCIHQPAEPVRFVALSYMWKGGSGEDDFQLRKHLVKTLEKPGSLECVKLPGVLRDTMALCKDMNERYLWVDRLCIIQDDPVSKMGQIQAMDKIYRSASFTIAAALANNEGIGLPGYRGSPRYPTPSTPRPVYNEEVYTNGLRRSWDEIGLSSSRWSARGWTFQERLLSKRTIFITEHEVKFECPEVEASEPETWSWGYMELLSGNLSQRALGCSPDELGPLLQQRKKEEEMEWFHGIGPDFDSTAKNVDFMRGSPPTFMEYCRWVQEYTSRQLSFPSDILNAFVGAGKVISEALDSRMLFGLPEKCLPQALMWERTEPRPGSVQVDGLEIPSWSWAHTIGQAQYWWMYSNGVTACASDEYRQTASLVACFYYNDPAVIGTHGLRRLDVEERWADQHVAMADLKDVAALPALEGAPNFQDWIKNEGWAHCPHSPWEAMARRDLDPVACGIAATLPGCLVFNTTVASLDQGFDYTTKTRFPEAVRDSEGRILGFLADMWAYETDRTRPQRVWESEGKVLDLIVICASVERFKSWKSWIYASDPDHDIPVILNKAISNATVMKNPDHDMWWLRVMLVEQVSAKPYVARKVGVGEIRMNKWKNLNPRWETVVLRQTLLLQ